MKRVIFTIAITGLLCGCNEKRAKIAAESLPIEVAYPVVQQVTLTREYPGYLDADATVAIVGRVNGTLEGSYYTAGQRVKKGDILRSSFK